MTNKDTNYIVICKDTGTDNVTRHVLATRQVFDSEDAASGYAKTCNSSCEPIVVEGRFWQLRSTPQTGVLSPLERIARVMFPDGNVEAEFDSGRLSDVKDELLKLDLDVWAFREVFDAALLEKGVELSGFSVERALLPNGREPRVAVRYLEQIVILSDFCELGSAYPEHVIFAVEEAEVGEAPKKVWERIWAKTWKPASERASTPTERWQEAVADGKTRLGLDAWIAQEAENQVKLAINAGPTGKGG